MSEELGHMTYTNQTPPGKYRCMSCGAHGVKLWREYQTFARVTTLECCDCAGTSQKKDVSSIDDGGKIPWESGKYADGSPAIQWIDQIGWRIPAVPTEDGSTFWGYSSVPNEGVNWRRELPNRMP